MSVLTCVGQVVVAYDERVQVHDYIKSHQPAKKKKRDEMSDSDHENIAVYRRLTPEEINNKRKRIEKLMKARPEKKKTRAEEKAEDEEGEGKKEFIDLGEFLDDVHFPIKKFGGSIDQLSRWLARNHGLPKGELVRNGKRKSDGLVKPEWLPGIMRCLVGKYQDRWTALGTFDSQLIADELEEWID